eukprot:5108321-Heterocapsa_arctica.AAC.1
MDGDDSGEDEAQVLSRQDAANELQHEYDQDFVPPFDNGGEMSSDDHSCDLEVDHVYDLYPPRPSTGPPA